MSDRGLRGTVALALGLLLAMLPCLGAPARTPLNTNSASPLTRVVTRATALSGASALRSGALASGELHLVGLRLVAPGARIDVPQGAPFAVPVALFLGNRIATAAEISQLVPANAQLVGTLSGPSISTQTLTGTVSAGLNVPGLPGAGDYTLADLRLMDGSTTVLQGEPATVAIRCLGEVIISSVTTEPMTKQEILDAGIQLGQGDYEARRFSMTLSLGGKTVDLKIPIAIPIYNGLGSPAGDPPMVGNLELKGLDNDLVPDLTVSVMDILPDASLTLKRPEVAHLLAHGFKGIVVIPGSIGYLKQFYKTNLVILNVLPDGSPYVVQNLKATLMLPPGADGAVGTPDDPLLAVSSGGESAELVKQIFTADKNAALKAGETGSALWFLRGDRLGNHEVKFYIQGEFAGGTLAAPIPITGTARGKLLVRNPTFDLMLVHPDVVRRGESYTLEARLTNTSSLPANDVSITLDRARLGNVKLVGDATQKIGTLKPGETGTMKFLLKALRDGEVTSSYLYMEEGGISFQLTTGLGERNIQLNPDTLLLPQTLDGLPIQLREAILRVLGQAHSVATTKGALPPGVLPIRSSTVQQTIATGLNENGLFIKMGVDKVRVWADLWRIFTRSDDPGFDQLMRTTEAGNELRSAFVETWGTWVSTGGSLADTLPFLATLAVERQLPTMAAVEGIGPGVVLGLVDASGAGVQSGDPLPILNSPGASLAVQDSHGFLQMPFSAPGMRLVLANQGAIDREVMVSVASPLADATKLPSVNHYTVHLARGASLFVDLGLARAPLATLNPPSANPMQIVPDSTSDVVREPFQALAVHRYDLELSPEATPFGTQVLVLFNRPNKTVDLPWGEPGFTAAQSLVQVEANRFWKKALPKGGFFSDEVQDYPPALIQAFPRIVSCYLEMPVGPNIPRALTLSTGWTSQSGEALGGKSTWPIQSGWIPGGAEVKGRVRKASGEAVKGTLFYWYLVTPEQGGVDLQSNVPFEDPFYALVSSNIHTADDGSFHFDYVPEPVKTAIGPFLLEADTDQGKAFGEATVLGNGQVLEFDLVLEGKGDIVGTVADSAGLPLKDVDVLAVQNQPSYGKSFGGGSVTLSAKTDANGRYRISGLKVGVFSLTFRSGIYGGARSGEIPRDGAVVEMNMLLVGKTGTVNVQVLNANGTPRPNQLVYLGLPGLLRSGGQVANFIYALSAETDAQGYAVFTKIPAGDLSAKIPFVPEPVPLWNGFLQPDSTVQATLRMVDPKQLGAVDISVVDGSGQGIPNAYFWWEQNPAGSDQPTGHTGLDGHITLPAPPGNPYSVWVVHPDWPASGVHSSFVTPGSGQTATLSVTLPARGFLKGHVTRPDGTPVAHALVAIPPVTRYAPLNHLTYTDTSGNYRLAGLSTTLSNPVIAIGPDLLTVVNKAVQGQVEQELQLDLVLPHVGHNTVKGHVYQPFDGGTPIPTIADVQLYMNLPSLSLSGGNWGSTIETFMGEMLSANSDGAYQFKDLPSASFRLAARSDLFPTWVGSTGAFSGPQQEVQKDLTLHSNFAASMEGQITDKDGQTKVGKGVRVILSGGGLGAEGLQVETLDTGRYVFAKAIPRMYGSPFTIRVEDPGTGRIAVDSIGVDQPTNYIKNLRLWGTGKLTLHLQDSLGNPLSTGDVSLSHSRSYQLDPNTDLPPLSRKLLPTDNGTMVFEDLIEGQISVTLRNPAGRVGVGSSEIPQGGGDRDLVIKLQPVGGIRGMLRRADGTPVPAGRVDAYRSGGWLGVSTTRQEATDGLFLFQDLPAGVVYLEAWDPDTRQIGRGSVTVPEAGIASVDIITLDKGPVNVVVLQEGQPVTKATVNLHYQGGPSLAFDAISTTGMDGKANFIVPPGTYAIGATDPVSLATGGVSFTRSNNQAAIDLSVTVQPVRTLAVTVVPPPGLVGDLTGWKVRSESGRTVTLGATTLAVLPDLPVGTHTLTLSDPLERFRGQGTGVLTAMGGPIQDAQARALARGNVDVTLLDDHGSPYPRGFVDLPYIPGDSGANVSTGTDVAGRTHFSGVLEGLRQVQGRNDNGLRRAAGSVNLTQEDETQTLTLTLSGTGGFEGTLKDGAGAPLPYTRVTYKPTNVNYGPVWELATNGQGHFEANQVPLGTYTLFARADGNNRSGARTVTLTLADQVVNADFVLSAAGTLKGVVTDPLRPNIGAVVVTALSNNSVVGSMTVDGSGAFELTDVPAQVPLDVRVTMDDGVTNAFVGQATVPGEGQTLVLPITMEPRPNLHGRTFEVDGSTPRSMTLRLYDPSAYYYSIRMQATSVDHPTYLISYLDPKATYTLVAYDDTFEIARATIHMQASPVQQEFDLRSKDITSVRGKVTRANSSLAWPSGATVRIGGVIVPLDPDGTLHLIGELRFDYSEQPLPVDVQVPGGPWWHVADAARVKNGFTELNLPAPAFGSAAIAILHKDGTPAANAAVAIDGIGSGSTNASGVWIALVVQAGTYHVRANSSTEIGMGELTQTTDGEQSSLNVMLDALLDVSGTYSYYFAGTVLFFQQDIQVEGNWGQNIDGFANRTFTGTLDGRILRGSWTSADGSHGKFNITFAPDASSYSGTWGLNDSETGNTWVANKNAGISVRLKPALAALKTAASLPLTVLVAGTPNKAVTWSASGGNITPEGIYTAPTVPGLYTVTAASVANPAAKATTTFSVSSDGFTDVSGSFGYYYAANVRVFQHGNQIEGDWWQNFDSFPARTITGTLDGLKATGTWLDGAGGSGQFVFTFPIDASFFDATWGTGTTATGNAFRAYRGAGVSLRMTPRSALLKTGATQAFTVLVAGSYNKDLIWSVSGGTITSDGLFTAPSIPGIYTVSVTSVADPNQKSTATVSVTTDGYLDVDGVFTGGSASDAMILSQAGMAITGQWSLSGVNRALIGTLDGYILFGTWVSTDDPTQSGRFSFTFDLDGQHCHGTWGPDGAPAANAWQGGRNPGLVGVFVRPFLSMLRFGAAQDFQAYVAGTLNHGVTWKVDAPLGSVDASGHYVAPLLVGSTAVRAVSVADPNAAGTAAVWVRLPMTVTPSSPVLPVGASQVFTATMTGFTNNAVIWTASNGTISSTGAYTAPATPGTCTITATSVEDPSLKATATVNVQPYVDVAPATVNLSIGDKKLFKATLTGLGGAVTWTCSGGTIDSAGTFTAPMTAGLYTVTATSIADPTKSGSAKVDVASKESGTLRVSVQTGTGRRLQGTSLTARATGSPTWTGVLQADGTYLIEGVWSGENLTLQASGFGTLNNPPSILGPVKGTTADVIWTAPNQGVVHGIVKDYRNQPLSGAVLAFQYGTISATTDATGAYALVGVSLGDWTLKATVPGQVIWTQQSVSILQDHDDKTLDFTLPGTGTVVIRALDRSGTTPLVAQVITLNTQGNGAGSLSLATDAQGLARFEGVMAGTVSGTADLEKHSVSVSGNLTAEALLNLDLKAMDATLVKGRLARTININTWPMGTRARIQGVDVPMAVDGTLQPVGGRLDFLYGTTPISIDVLVPGAVPKHLADLPMVKDGETLVELSAPALATLDLTVTKQDGSVAVGAIIGGPGLVTTTADAAGKAQLLAWAGTVTVSGVLGTQFNHQDATITTDGAVAPITLQLGEGLDVSGVFRVYDSSAGWGDWVLFQDGTRITGTFNGTFYSRVIEATLVGNTVDGTWREISSLANPHGLLHITFAADLASFSGTYGNGNSATGYSLTGTRQAGQIRVMVVPTATTVAVNGSQTFKALVVGTSIKTVTWSATNGTIAAAGLFTAPAARGFATVRATSTEAADQSGSARVCITSDGHLDGSGVFGYWSNGYWGNWINDWVLHQNGTIVAGNWSSLHAHISGTLSGRVVSGTWKDLSGTNEGRIELTLDEDGGAFTGVYGYGAELPSQAVRGLRSPDRIGLFARPAFGKVRIGSTTTLTSYVVGTPNTAVNWASYPGTVSSEGVFTAPSSPANSNISVISQADPSQTYAFTLEAVAPVVVAPATATLPVGGTLAFTTTLTGFVNSAVIWTCNGGVITAEGVFTAPMASGVITITATSIEDSSQNGTATVSVRPFIEVNPTHVVLSTNGTQQFTYQVTGLGNYVAWSCSAGTIDSNGLYTAPAVAGTCTITATGYYDPTKSASATVDVRSTNVRILPGSASLYSNESMAFMAAVDGLANQAVTWSVQDGSGSIDANGVFTAPASAGTSTVKATSVQDSTVFSTAQVEVLGINILSVELLTADGRPVVDRPFQLVWEGGPVLSVTTDAAGKFTLQRLPFGKVLTLVDRGSTQPNAQQYPFWYPVLQNRSLTFTQSGQTQGLSLVLPVGKLNLQFRRGSSAIPGVNSSVSIAGKYCPWQWPNLADASGNWSLLDVPLNMNLALSANRATITVNKTLQLDQPEKTITVEWPPLAGKQTVKVLRSNGAPITNPVDLGALNFQAYPGNDDGTGAPDEGSGAEQSWTRMVSDIQQTALVQLEIPTPFSVDCGEWRGPFSVSMLTEGKFTPGPAPETHELRLPVKMGLRLRFQDKDGMPLPASLHGDQIVLSYGSYCNTTYAPPNLNDCLLPEMFLEGPQVLHLRSERWGELPDIIFTVAPTDDGLTLIQIVKLPWVKTNFEVKVQASDHETPVPGAVVSLTTDGQTIELGRIPEGMKDTDTLKGSIFGHEATDLKLEASFTPRRQTAAVTEHLDNQPTGGTLKATLTLPLTVLRTHLTETNGTELEGQGLDAKTPSDKGDSDPEPTASIGDKVYGLVLGEPAGATMDLRLFDPASGLGILQSAVVPLSGTHLDVATHLAPHAWLTSAILTSAPTAPYLLVALGRDAPGLVKPEAASWLQGPLGLGSLKAPVFMYSDSLDPNLSWIRPAAEVPDPANPPQPSVVWNPKVRIPLAGSFWATAWTLNANDLGDGTFDVYPVLDPYGKGALAATQNQEVTASAEPLTWVWKDFSLQVVDAGGLPLSDQLIQTWPQVAPGSWQLASALSDVQGLWIVSQPLEQLIHAQTAPPDGLCGAGTWLFGSLDYTPTDPPPVTPPVVQAIETRDLPPCPPPVAKTAKVARASKPSSKNVAPPRRKKAGHR